MGTVILRGGLGVELHGRVLGGQKHFSNRLFLWSSLGFIVIVTARNGGEKNWAICVGG